MSTTPDITQPSSFHHEEEGHGHAKAPFGMRAACTILAVAAVILAYMVFQRNALLVQSRTQLTQANADAAQARTDMNAAKSQSAGLQSQLDQAQSQQANTTAELTKLQTDRQALQAQIKNLQDGRSALQSQLAADKAQTTELQSQLSQAEDRSSALAKQVEAADNQTADLKAQLAKAQEAVTKAEPAALALTGMPISTSFEKSFWGGYTLHVSNLKSDPLVMTITIAGSDSTPVTTTVASGATFDMKHLAAGANVTITSAGFDTVHLVAH